MTTFNGNVADNLKKMVENICARPAMWVGQDKFEKVAIFLDGYTHAMLDDVQSHILHTHFQRFLVKKYGYEAARKMHEEDKRRAAEARARGEEPEFELSDDDCDYPLYGNIIWWSIYNAHFKGLPDKELIALFKEDFDQFADPLTRMAIEAS